MKKWKISFLFAVIAIVSLGLTACSSNTNDVPSLGATPTPVVEEETLDGEAAVMAFVQCMRDEGIEFQDQVIDFDGNVQAPELVEGSTVTRAELAAPYEACFHHIESLTFGREREDVTEQVDQFVALAACLREQGYDVDDPTSETFEQWSMDFRVEFDWDDPDATAAYEDCSSNEE